MTQPEPKTFRISVATDATLDEIADWVAAALGGTDELVEFVTVLDAVVAETAFSTGVRDAMNAVLAEEQAESGSPEEVLRGKLDQLWGWAKSGRATYPGDGGEYYAMDVENVDAFTDNVLQIFRSVSQ